MPGNTAQNKELYIKLIEKQKLINGRFHNVKRIDPTAGDGCFSLVFKAKDNRRKKNNEVAIKVLNPQVDEYREKCFHREAEILKQLNGQRNILPLIQEKQRLEIPLKDLPPFSFWYYVSPLGLQHAGHYIYDSRTDYLTNILLFREMCKAVQRIHNNGICHRDIKPDNFIRFGDHDLKLSDFGTARHLGAAAERILSNYTFPVGDKRYTAPEILCGLGFSDEHLLCGDVYSLGSILFEMFTKVTLGPAVIYRDREIEQLIHHFHSVPETNRIRVFDGFVEAFSDSRPLFSVRTIDDSIPKYIAYEIDRLYRSMVNLNYRKRETNFNRIFLRINIIEKILNNQRAFEKWRELKRKRLKAKEPRDD